MGMFDYYSWHTKLPDENLSVYEPYLHLFFETMYERMMIWKRRFIEERPRPWTDNAILRDAKFTNVYRELDRNSQWQIRNILLKSGEMTLLNLIWKMMVFRTFNNPETFMKGMQWKGWRSGVPDWKEYDENEFAEFIAEVRKGGQNPFTNAYLINSMATPGRSRDYCYTRLVIPMLRKHIPQLISIVRSADTPERIITYLKTLPSVSDFIAHEYYQDFTYIPRYTDHEFMKFTQNDFTNVGPGASVGIRLIYPNLKTTREQKQAIYWLRDAASEQLSQIGAEKGEPMGYLEWDKEQQKYRLSGDCNITLHQIEMWLCEFQKYWKMVIGEGKQRSKFVPKTTSLAKDICTQNE